MNKSERIEMLENALKQVNTMNEKMDKCITKVNSMNNSIEELKGSLEVIANFSGDATDATEHINLKRDLEIVKETIVELDHVSATNLTVYDYVKDVGLGIDDITIIQERLNEYEGIETELVDLFANGEVVYTVLKVVKY